MFDTEDGVYLAEPHLTALAADSVSTLQPKKKLLVIVAHSQTQGQCTCMGPTSTCGNAGSATLQAPIIPMKNGFTAKKRQMLVG